MTLRELLDYLEKGEWAGDNWTEYTLHSVDLDRRLDDIVREATAHA